jgi:2,4-diketo-3-deoxy-L-fuconate hydrolase
MRSALIVVVALIAVLVAVLVAATARLAGPKFDERLSGDPVASLEIAPIEEAITLGRLDAGGDPHVVLVTRSGPDGLEVVDLQAAFGRPFRDAVDAIDGVGLDALTRLALDPASIRERIQYEDLGLPIDAAYPHIAAGTNFRAHAEEVGREEGPFLFPKLSQATAWNALVPDRARLDYEVELCAVTLTLHTASKPARLGYVLCNDFTDRWTLVSGMDLGGPMGLSGFPDGKGGDGMLTIGPLLVIPRDADAFYRDLSLDLYVDGALRQRGLGGQMIWSPAEVLARSLDDCALEYSSKDGPVGLADCAGIPARTLVLTGTPAGVLFHPVTLWSKQAYLTPGDEVVAVATHLGVLRNRVE